MGENLPTESYYSSHVTAIVTSGRLNPSVSEDREALEALEAYERAISHFNASLRIVGRSTPGIFLRQDLIHTNDSDSWPARLEDAFAPPFAGLRDAHETVKSLLERQYPWSTSKTESP
jgi:hypothetical protein